MSVPQDQGVCRWSARRGAPRHKTSRKNPYARPGDGITPVGGSGIFTGGPQSGLQPHGLILADDPWMHGYPDTEIHAPLFNDDDLAAYIADCNKKGASVTMNIGVYEDGTASAATLDQLATIRRIIRGN